MKILLSFICLLTISYNGFSDSVENKIKNHEQFNGNEIEIISGNFSESYDTTFLVQKIDWGGVKKIYFVYLTRNKQLEIIEIMYSGSIELDEREISMIDNQYFRKGTIINNVKIYDFNQNGVDDFLIYQLGGIGTACKIMEFREKEVVNLLSFEPNIGFAYPIQLKENNILRIFHKEINLLNQEGKPIPVRYKDYKWDSENEQFVVVNEGHIDTFWNTEKRWLYPLDEKKDIEK
jgi:hypothetical protein